MIDAIDDIVFRQEDHSYTIRGREYPSVTTVIRNAGFGHDFSKAPKHLLNHARARGNAVHLACHYIDTVGLDFSSVDEQIRGYVEAYARFKAKVPITIIESEKRMAVSRIFQEKELTPLAGTPDRIVWLYGRRAVIDLKTGVGCHIQTAGYADLYNRSHSAPVMERYELRLLKDGTYKFVRHDDPMDFFKFRDALRKTHADMRVNKWRKK